MNYKNLQQALKLAKHGLRVFPCRGYGDKAKVPIAGIKWTEEATTDEPTIRNWWAKHPKAIPALPAGLNNLLVVDCDLREDANGINNFLAYLESNGFNGHDDLTHVLTPSGGKHFYFRQPKHSMLGNLTGDLPAGIDVRGKGGYVIAFGAVLEDGREYTLKNDFNSLTELPNFLLDTLTSKSKIPPVHQNNLSNKGNSLWQRGVLYALGALDSIPKNLVTIGAGGRNIALYNGVYRLCTFFNAGLLVNLSDIENKMRSAGILSGLSENETVSTIQSAIKGASGVKFDLHVLEDKNKLNDFNNSNYYPNSNKKHSNSTREIVYLEQEVDLDKRVEESSAEELEGLVSYFNLEEYLDGLCNRGFPYTLYPFSGDYRPKGVMEDIIDWVLSNSKNGNVYPLALNVAISIVSLCASRFYYSPSGSSLHLYTVTIADTGVGKQLLLDSLDDLITDVGLRDCIGARGFKSDVYLEDVIKNKPRVLCMIDEFGDYFKGINSAKASTHMQSITEILRSLWGLSRKVYVTSGSRSNPSETVYSPCLSIAGVSTPAQFFEGMTASNLANGSANRFQLFVTERQQEENKARIFDPNKDYSIKYKDNKPSMSMIESLKIIAGTNLSYDMGRNSKGQPFMTETLKWANVESAFFYDDFTEELRSFCDKSRINYECYSRVAEKAIRLASLFALSRGIDAKVDVPDLLYGLCLAVQSANYLKSNCLFANASNQYEEKVNLVLRVIAKAEDNESLIKRGLVTKNGVNKRHISHNTSFKFKGDELTEILRNLEEGMIIKGTLVKTRTRTSYFYRLNRKHPLKGGAKQF